MVCRIHCSLYGLKQAPHAVFERFASMVNVAHFSASAHDHAWFVHLSTRGQALLLLYVDAMIITSEDPEYIAFVKAQLSDHFLMSDLGLLRYFLGIEVSSTSDGFFISQEKYTHDLLACAILLMSALLRVPWSSMHIFVRLMVTSCLIQRIIIILLGVLFISLSLVLISPTLSIF